MCLQTKQKKPKITKKHITVYKELEPNYRSPIRGFFFDKGVVYKTEIKQSGDWCGADSVAVRFMNDRYPGWQFGTYSKKMSNFGFGFHFAFKKERLLEESVFNRSHIIVKSYLPKGTEYYVGFTGLGVSNQIIIGEKIEI